MNVSPQVLRVSGPLVEVECPRAVAMHDLVGLGPHDIPGEVMAISDSRLTVQAFEYTGGLRPGDQVTPRGGPLSAPLGPGLLGGVFDGLLRSLSGAPTWLASDGHTEVDSRRWQFAPTVTEGTDVGAGSVLGVVRNAGSIEHRVQVPPGAAGTVEFIVPAGSYRRTPC